MRKYLFFAVGVFLLVPLIYGQRDNIQNKDASARILKIRLHYTGSGQVDEKHKIFVVLFDSPDFANGGAGPPIAVKTATVKEETVTFSEVATSPVYAAASYDPGGNYDGESGPPPSGASLGMYSKTPGTPAPIGIERGKTVQVELTFDNTVKMP
jgi:hypothetical protein